MTGGRAAAVPGGWRLSRGPARPAVMPYRQCRRKAAMRSVPARRQGRHAGAGLAFARHIPIC